MNRAYYTETLAGAMASIWIDQLMDEITAHLESL